MFTALGIRWSYETSLHGDGVNWCFGFVFGFILSFFLFFFSYVLVSLASFFLSHDTQHSVSVMRTRCPASFSHEPATPCSPSGTKPFQYNHTLNKVCPTS